MRMMIQEAGQDSVSRADSRGARAPHYPDYTLSHIVTVAATFITALQEAVAADLDAVRGSLRFMSVILLTERGELARSADCLCCVKSTPTNDLTVPTL